MGQSWAVAGVDPHKETFTVAVVDGRGGRCGIEAFAMTDEGFAGLREWLDGLEITLGRIGVEGANGLGRQLARFLVSSGFEVREVQPNRTAERRRRRRRQKTDREDAEAIARETLAHDDLPPAGKQQVPDPAWGELVAMRNRRDSLCHQRVRLLNEAEAVLCTLALGLRAELPRTSRVRPRIQALVAATSRITVLSAADKIHVGWLAETAADLAELDRRIKVIDRRIPALLDQLGTTLTEEVGIGAVCAMELLAEIGDPGRFRSEGQFARWCGVAPVAASSGEGRNEPARHRLDLAGNRHVNSVFHTMHITQIRCHPPARQYVDRKRSEGRPTGKRGEHTSASLPTASSGACGTTASAARTRPPAFRKPHNYIP